MINSLHVFDWIHEHSTIFPNNNYLHYKILSDVKATMSERAEENGKLNEKFKFGLIKIQNLQVESDWKSVFCSHMLIAIFISIDLNRKLRKCQSFWFCQIKLKYPKVKTFSHYEMLCQMQNQRFNYSAEAVSKVNCRKISTFHKKIQMINSSVWKINFHANIHTFIGWKTSPISILKCA